MMRKQNEWTQDTQTRLVRRLMVVGTCLVLWMSVVCLRLYELQVTQQVGFQARSEAQQQGYIEIQPQRGEIRDRHLNPLAVSVPVESLFAHPAQVEDARQAARRLAAVVEQPERELLDLLKSDKKFVYLARRLPPKVARQALDLAIPGVFSHMESRRAYPSKSLASHVLGFVGTDGQGLDGLEYRYDEQLRGEKARVNVLVDAKRRAYSRETMEDRTRGNTLVLNVDQDLQFIVEQVLSETVESSRAKSGSAILMDPNSGAILAMASFPTFNPNRYSEYDPEAFRNRAIREIYEPGSTFKSVTLSAVLNEGLVESDEEIDCRVGTLRLGNKVYRESSHSYGTLNFREIVAKSSNIGTIKLSLRLGEENLYEYIRRFGFGEKSGIDLPGEEAGILRSTDQWSKMSIGALSIGQEIGVTPLQVVSAISTIANGGFQVQPHIVSRIQTTEGDLVWEPTLERHRVVKQETTRRMRDALKMVVESGTGKLARIHGYSSAGKTGTAQKFVDGAYSKTKYMPSYVGFVPVERPRLAAVVVINEPTGQYYGGRVVAPAFRQIMERALRHLKVPRDLDTAEPRKQRRRNVAEAELPRDRRLSPLEPELSDRANEGAAEQPVGRKPRSGQHVVSLGEESGQIPDVSGLSLREVLKRSNRMGIRLNAVGSGVAVSQSPAPGTSITPWLEFKVHFSNRGGKPNATFAVDRAKRGRAGSGAFR